MPPDISLQMDGPSASWHLTPRSIRAHVAPFPDVMRTFLIAMWLLLPFAAHRVARAWTWNPRLFSLKRSDQWFVAGSSLLIAGFCFGFLYFFVDDPATPLESVGGRGGVVRSVLRREREHLVHRGRSPARLRVRFRA